MRIFLAISLNVLLFGPVSTQQVPGQVKTPTPPPEQTPDVVRVRTELVQTDLIVVDKRGHFVRGLTADDFELRVDSKAQALSFFEEVAAGSPEEEKQLTAAQKGDAAAIATLPRTTRSQSDRGRVIFFLSTTFI